jgi:release factor glutamine methyltransferase
MNLDILQKQLYQSIPGLQSPDERYAVARLLLDELTINGSRSEIHGENLSLSESGQRQLNTWISELASGKPVQYVLGNCWFLDLRLIVSPEVLIPRPETEELVTLILSMESGAPHILDLGTGSGCIAIGLKNHLQHAEIIATDISLNALEIARQNALNYKLTITFLEHNMLTGPASLPKDLDILVSNPPYIAESELTDLSAHVTDFEPHVALFAPDSEPLVFYKAIRAIALHNLKRGGRVYLEINQQLGVATAALFQHPEFASTQVIKDMSGNDRFVVTTRC